MQSTRRVNNFACLFIIIITLFSVFAFLLAKLSSDLVAYLTPIIHPASELANPTIQIRHQKINQSRRQRARKLLSPVLGHIVSKKWLKFARFREKKSFQIARFFYAKFQ
jgi:hypothetical protein